MAAFKVRLADGSEMGPLDIQMLRSWYQQGLVGRDSQVRAANSRRWVRLGEAVDISSWGASGGSTSRIAAQAEEEDAEPAADEGPQRWRTMLASLLFLGMAAGSGYFWLSPARWLPELQPAPWREIALGFLALALMLVRGWEGARKVVRVIVFLLSLSVFALAAPVLLHGFQWRPLAVLGCAWVLASGLFFFLAGRALPWTSVALCLFWMVAGAAGIGYLGMVPAGGSAVPTTAASAAAAGPDDAVRAPWSPTASAVTRELPLLSPRAAELVVSYGLDRPESAFKQSYLLAANGVGRLSAQEAKELGELTTAVYAPLPAPNRRRLDGYMERVRGLQATQPQEDREMSALVREAVLQLPAERRARYQALYDKALGVAAAP